MRLAQRGLLLVTMLSSGNLACSGESSPDATPKDDGAVDTAVGADSSIDAESGAPLDAKTFFERWQTKMCTETTKCCDAVGLRNTGCLSSLNDKDFSGAIGKGVEFDPAMAATCLTDLETWFASCDKDGGGPPSCQHVLRGTITAGNACDFAGECAPPATGRVLCETAGSATKVCKVRPLVGAGESCVLAGDPSPTAGVCDFGLECTSGRTCVRQAALGEACGATFCRIGLQCRSGSCVPRDPVGAACNPVLNACRFDAYCDGTTCQPRKADGEACDTSSDECAGTCTAKVCGPNGLGSASVVYGLRCYG